MPSCCSVTTLTSILGHPQTTSCGISAIPTVLRGVICTGARVLPWSRIQPSQRVAEAGEQVEVAGMLMCLFVDQVGALCVCTYLLAFILLSSFVCLLF